MGLLLPPGRATGLSLSALEGLSGATPRGAAVDNCRATPQERDGLSARQMAVVWTFASPLCVATCAVNSCATRGSIAPLSLPATPCHQRSHFETYSRYKDLGRSFLLETHTDQLASVIVQDPIAPAILPDQHRVSPLEAGQSMHPVPGQWLNPVRTKSGQAKGPSGWLDMRTGPGVCRY